MVYSSCKVILTEANPLSYHFRNAKEIQKNECPIYIETKMQKYDMHPRNIKQLYGTCIRSY